MTKLQGWFACVVLTLIAGDVADDFSSSVIAGILYAVAWIGLWWSVLEAWEKRRA